MLYFKQLRRCPGIGLLLVISMFFTGYGCTSDSNNPLDNGGNGSVANVIESKSATIGTGGGSVILTGGGGVVFPAGALSSSADITVKSISPETFFSEDGTSRVVILCEGVTGVLNASAELRVPLPVGFTSADSTLVSGGYIDEATGSVEAEPVTVRIIDGNPFAVIEATHFSYRLIEWIFGKQIPGSAGPLEIPYYGQGASNFCWATCIQMLTTAAKHDENAEVFDIIGEVGVDEGGITDWSFRFNSVIKNLIKTRTGIIPTRYQWDYINKNCALDYIRREIGVHGRPVAIYDPSWNHAVVIVGYNGTTLLIHNPNNTNISEIGYTARNWSEFAGKTGVRDKLVTIAIPVTLDSTRPMVTANIMSGAFEFIKPQMGPSDPSKIYRFKWDYSNSKGYSFKEPTTDTAAEPLPGTVTTFRQGGDIEIVNVSRSAQKNISAWLEIYGYGPTTTHYSKMKQFTVGPNRSGQVKFDDIQVDEFRSNDTKAVEYEATITVYVDDERSDISSILFKIDTVVPKITAISPTTGNVGDQIAITGSGFGIVQGISKLTFGGIEATAIASWGETEIIATVPADAKTGPVVVTRGSVASGGVPFTIAAVKTMDGSFNRILSLGETFDHNLKISMQGSWRITGKGMVPSLSDSTNIIVKVEYGSSGTATITGNAELIGEKTQTVTIYGMRHVYNFKNPRLRMPIKGQTYSHNDDAMITAYSSSASEIAFDYAFDWMDSYGHLIVDVEFEVTYDHEVYNREGELTSSTTDNIWQNYRAYVVYIMVNTDE